MKKKEIKGLSAFELLEGLDDDMILSASLPEAVPVAPPTVGEKITAFFGRMGKGGMAAAITGIVVAVAVLVGIALTRPPVDIDPPDTDPSHGIHGSLPDTDHGIVAPPLTQNPEQEKGPVAVTSDGITVYPQGYCVWESGQHRNEQGELEGYDADGRGAVDMLDRLWDMLPVLRTAGNDFDAVLPDHMTLRSVRVFEMVEVQTKTFVELALISGEMEDYRDRPWEFLSTLRGEYTVVLEVYHEINYSADEYTKGVDEYAFRLDVDPTMNEKAPVRVIHGDKTYFPTGYLLEASYYDAELKKEVVDHFGGAESILEHLVKDMVTATVTQGESLSLYLAPFYDLKSVKVYRDMTLWALSETEEPLTQLSEWDTGDYYVIITAAHIGTGETLVNEYPIHIRVVEKTEQETEDETYPNDDGEAPEPPDDTQPPVPPPETNPRVVVSGGGQSAVFEAEEDGFLAWREVDLSHIQGTPAASVIFADDDAMRALPDMEIFYSDRLTVTLDAAGDELLGVILYDAKGEMIAESNSLSVVDSLENDGWDRGVILVLQIVSSVSETERVCYEYAIDLTIRVPAPPSGEPVDVMIGSEFILPFAVQVSVREWTGSKFDGWNGMLAPLSSFADEIPTAEYTATTRIRISSEQESQRQQKFKRFEIRDADFNQVKNETPNEYTALDDLHAALNQLSPGTYYLILEVVKYGQYVESHHQWEEWETHYFVALTVS